MFYIKLLQTPIKDSKNENIIFDDFNSQRDYFQLNNLVNYPKCNFSVNDGIESIATVYYTQIENKPQYGVYYTLNCNYAVVYDDNAVHNYEKYRFYFVTKIQHNAQLSQYIVYLHLDIIQTYYMYLHFDKCLINRCTFNRFTDENSRLFTRINFRKDSQLLLSDDINVSNYIVKEKFRIKPQQLSGSGGFGVFDDINNFLLNNVKYWKYVFLNNITDTVFARCIGNNRISDNQRINELTKLQFDGTYTNITCLCAPVFANNTYSIYLQRKEVDENNNEKFYLYKFDSFALDNYIKSQNLTGYILTEKISKMSPFMYHDFLDSKFNYNNGNLYINDNFEYVEDNTRIYSTQRYNFLCPYYGSELAYNELFMQISSSIPKTNVYIYYNSDNYSIWLQDIKTYLSNILLNDIKQTYIDTKELLYKYRICLFDNNEKHYIKNSSIYYNMFKLKYYENLIPDISRYIYDIEVGENSIMYNYDKVMNFVLGSKDTYYLFEQNKYDTFIANNKNFYDTFTNTQIGKGFKGFITSLADTVTGFAGGDGIAPNPLRGIAGLKTAINTGIDIAVDTANMHNSMDDLKSAPSDIKNINGNIYLNTYYNDYEAYIIYEQAVDCDLTNIKYIMKRYGFTYSKNGNIKDNTIQSRKYYNYIKAVLNDVYIDYDNRIEKLSNAIYNELKSIFQNGIALFRYNDYKNDNIESQLNNHFDYDINNYEKYIDNI